MLDCLIIEFHYFIQFSFNEVTPGITIRLQIWRASSDGLGLPFFLIFFSLSIFLSVYQLSLYFVYMNLLNSIKSMTQISFIPLRTLEWP
jgi:hypothetical protein